MSILRCLVLTVLMMSLIFFWQGYGFRINITESLPHSLYLSTPKQLLAVGQIVTFNLPDSRVTFAKQIAALPGDLIEVKNRSVCINGLVKGMILEPFEPITAGIVPEGCCFMLGEHPLSFDSRYADFGLVPQDTIKENLCYIF